LALYLYLGLTQRLTLLAGHPIACLFGLTQFVQANTMRQKLTKSLI
jgi:hypothetical protein